MNCFLRHQPPPYKPHPTLTHAPPRALHTQRLSRQFGRTAAQLRELQKIRLDVERSQLSDLVNIIEMHESKGKTYNPSSDGFVFTEHEIARAIQSGTGRNLATQAFRAAATSLDWFARHLN